MRGPRRQIVAARSRVSSGGLPLASLRARQTPGTAEERWTVDADGVTGRVLVVPAGGYVTWPLRLSGEVSLRARAMLSPHDWRDRDGVLRVWVSIAAENGSRRELWARTLRAGDGGRARGHRLDCAIPASTTALTLGVDRDRAGRSRPLERAIWLEPTLHDPQAPRTPAPAPIPRPSGSTAPGVRTTGRSAGPASAAAGDRPLISVLMPVHDPPAAMLAEAIASVLAQTFAHWELCIVDDGSRDPEIEPLLARHAAAEPRIRVVRRDRAGGIADATNAALEVATGEYVALLDHDDALAPDALEAVAARVAEDPELDMVYTDEDIVLDGRRIWVHAKPDWSPDTLRTNGYTCHLGVYRRWLVERVGSFRSAFDGSQDVDMILRLTESTDRIAHIPRVLYHWHAHRSSTAGGDAKPYAYVAARHAIAAHLERIGLDARVDFGPPGLYRVTHRIDPATTVDIVVAVRDDGGLQQAAASWIAQSHPAWRVVLAGPRQVLGGAAAALARAGIDRERVVLREVAPGAGTAAALATGATDAEGECLLLMEAPAIGLTHDWLARLIGYAQQPGIAAAGPVVLAGDGRVQQGGIALPEGIPLHLLRGSRTSMDHLFGYGTSVYNVSAVSGALATRRETYERLGGIDASFGELALIHYCLRGGATGDRAVIVPDARLRAAGPEPVVNDLGTIWRLRRAWAQLAGRDPYYNPSFRTDRGDFELARGAA